MVYSRFLYTEYEQQCNEEGEGGYTIFSTPQPLDAGMMVKSITGVLKFGVLWSDGVDTRVIQLIEEAIVLGILRPVRLMHASKGALTILVDSKEMKYESMNYLGLWEEVAGNVLWGSWTVELLYESDLGSLFAGGRQFRQYAPAILAVHKLGISSYTYDMFLFKNEWTQEAVFGSEQELKEDLDFDDDNPLF